MNVMVFDTETTSLTKPFCYNVGYIILDTATGTTLKRADYVIEQVWHNLPLFSTAYYADKRQKYVSAMRGKRATLEKWGYVCQQMARDIKRFEVASAYAYNSPFDDGVFAFNCDWFKTKNPFDNVPVYDIRGYAHNFICHSPEYIAFCEEHELFTEAGNYSTTAEALFQFMDNNPDFVEEHTGLADSEIEGKILLLCLTMGAELAIEYPIQRSFERKVEKTLEIYRNKEKLASFKCYKVTVNKERTKITLK